MEGIDSFVRFKAGDDVPEWVFRADGPGRLAYLRFGVDVIVSKDADGTVTVSPVKSLESGDAMFRGEQVSFYQIPHFVGAPTILLFEPI